MSAEPRVWDRVVDVIVVGSGGAALTAATLAHDGGAEVLVLEKSGMLGGTTAVSGGGVWLPGNHVMAEAGIADSREDALAYIRRLAGGPRTRPRAPRGLRRHRARGAPVSRGPHTTQDAHLAAPRLLLDLGDPREPADARPLRRGRPLPRPQGTAGLGRPARRPRDAHVVGRGDDADRGLHAADARAARGATSPRAGGHPAEGRRARRAPLQRSARTRRGGDAGDAGT